MRDVTSVDASRLYVPQFLDADAVHLRIQAVELQLIHELLGEGAARAFGQHGDLGAQLVAGREVVLGLAVFVHAFVFGQNAGDSFFSAVRVIDQIPAGKLGEEVDAFFFHQAAEPFGEFVDRDHVVAVILQRRWRDGKLPGVFFGEVVGGVAGDWRIERRSLFEIGNKLAQAARVHDRAGKLVRADLARLLEHVNIFSRERGRFLRLGVLLDQIRQVQRTGKPARPRADD